MDLGIATFRLLALSQAVLFGAVVLSSRAAWPRRLLLLLLTMTVGAYLALPLALAADWPLPLRASLGVLATLCPLALLLVVLDLFEERAFDARVAALVVACSALAIAQVMTSAAPLGPVVTIAMHVVKICLVGVAGLLLWRGRKSELVELRLWMRGGLVLAIGVVALAVLTVEWAFAWRVPASVELPGMAAIFVLALLVNLAFWRLDPGLTVAATPIVQRGSERAQGDTPAPLRSPGNTATSGNADATAASGDTAVPPPGAGERIAADPLLARIEDLMRAERLHADHDLRIATLAARLGVPEYRVRRAINGGLGFRNFNHYVNSFRIDEASRRLLGERHLPVLSIALDVGFRSMSSFNVAFRERHGCSPGEFRNAEGADS